ncbi:unnamed protein product [Peniophora sp. CBMAI 1063]|nr:unnamed protein product [Peniophora sp. CBMAI 1063]
MATAHQFALRPVDMRDAASPARHPSHYDPPSSSSPSSTSSASSYGGASAGLTKGHGVYIPDVNPLQGPFLNVARSVYPPPPTGHDLMRLFPPPPPCQFSELKGGPTSYYFRTQERAFFAQAGREEIRIRLNAEFAPRPSPPLANIAVPTSMPLRNRAPQQGHIHPHPYHVS